jgi:hypothetical protein
MGTPKGTITGDVATVDHGLDGLDMFDIYSHALTVPLRWFALIRIWSPWLAPRQGKTHFALDEEAVVCSFMEPGGRHLVLLAISGVQDVMTLFKSDEEGNVVLNVCRLVIQTRVQRLHYLNRLCLLTSIDSQ